MSLHIHRTGWLRAPARLPDAQIAAAIGDVHGCARHLDALLEALAVDLSEHPGAATLVYLGDYIDRGPDSRAVLARVADRCGIPGIAEVRLRGNHEDWLLDIVHGRVSGLDALDWLAAGGDATLRAFGYDPGRLANDPSALRRALQTALDPATRDMLAATRLSHRIGPYLFVHAGVHPRGPLDLCDASSLLWIRDRFLEIPEGMWDHPGIVAVHGHTPGSTQVRHHRVGVDSGAFETGILSAVLLSGDRLQYVSVAEPWADPRWLPPISAP